jgi:hypothetical protein
MERRLYPIFSLREGKIVYSLIILTKIIFDSLLRNIVSRLKGIILSCWALQYFFRCDIYFVEIVNVKKSLRSLRKIVEYSLNIDYGGFLGPPLPLFLWKPNQRQLSVRIFLYQENFIFIRVADPNPDPDPPDPHVLGLPDPDPLVRGMDPDPDSSIINQK